MANRPDLWPGNVDLSGIERGERCVSALRRLVQLKDGPRDSAYHEQKPLAWQEARDALEEYDRG